MQEEAAEELFQRQSHQALLVLVRRVAPTKSDLSIFECDQSVIGNGHAMRVAAQITERVFGSAERTLGIDHPVGAEQGSQHGGERRQRLERRKATVKFEPAGGMQFPQTGGELPAKDTAEDLDGQKEAGRRSDPPGVIGRQSAGRNDTVDMRVMASTLTIP